MSRADRRSTRKLSSEEKEKAVNKIIELRDEDGLNWEKIGAQFRFSASTARNFYREAKKIIGVKS